MTTRRTRPTRSRSRGPKPIMAWFNNGLDPQTLAANTTATADMTTGSPPFPAGFQSGFTILRLILTLVIAPSVSNAAALGLAALYVATQNSLTVPPNLNADLLDYYWFKGYQVPAGGGTFARNYDVDLRSARRVRGEDRALFFHIRNNDLVNPVEFGVEMRMLLKKS